MKMKVENYNNAIMYLELFISQRVINLNYKVIKNKQFNKFTVFKQNYKEKKYFEIPMEGNDHTIFTSPNINIKARVWHDDIHIKLDKGFTLDDETDVAEEQCREIREYFKDKLEYQTISNMQRIIMTEVVSQLQYYERYGKYIPHQRSFVQNELFNR